MAQSKKVKLASIAASSVIAIVSALGVTQLSVMAYLKEELKDHKTNKQILKDAREEAERLLREANAKIENTIRTIVEAKAEKEAREEFYANVLEQTALLRELQKSVGGTKQ